MAPLNAAFPFAEMNHFAVLIAQHLKFDVPRALDEFFRVHVRVAEGLLRFAARRLVVARKSSTLAHDAHAAAAAARRCFQNQRVADLGGRFRKLLFAFDNSVAAGNGRQTGRANSPAAHGLCRPSSR